MAPSSWPVAVFRSEATLFAWGRALRNVYGPAGVRRPDLERGSKAAADTANSAACAGTGSGPGGEEIILACLEVNPLHRPASAGAVAERWAAAIVLPQQLRWDVAAARNTCRDLRSGIAAAPGSRVFAGRIFGGLAPLWSWPKAPRLLLAFRWPDPLRFSPMKHRRRSAAWGIRDSSGHCYGFFQLRDDARRSGRRTFWYRQSPAPMEILGFRSRPL